MSTSKQSKAVSFTKGADGIWRSGDDRLRIVPTEAGYKMLDILKDGNPNVGFRYSFDCARRDLRRYALSLEQQSQTPPHQEGCEVRELKVSLPGLSDEMKRCWTYAAARVHPAPGFNRGLDLVLCTPTDQPVVLARLRPEQARDLAESILALAEPLLGA